MTAPVVILNLGHTALGIARNLRHRRVPVIAVHHSRAFAIGRGSRLMEIRTGPDSGAHSSELAGYLEALAAELGERPVLFPTRDLDVYFIESHRDRLQRAFILAQPAGSRLMALVDKPRLLGRARELGIPIPRTATIANPADTALEHLRDFAFPVIAKPAFAHELRVAGRWDRTGRAKAHVFAGYEECAGRMPALLAAGNAWFLQEFVGGPVGNLVICGGYVGRDGTILGHFTARKVVQVPEQSGLGIMVDSMTDEHGLMEMTRTLLEAVGYRGLFEAEYKLDDAGTPRLIEINPRHWDQHRLATACGVNLTDLAYRDLTGQHVEPVGPTVSPVRWYDDAATLKLKLIGLLKRERQYTLPATGASPRRYPSIWDAGDPVPALLGYHHALGEVFGRTVRAVIAPGRAR